MKVEPRVSYAVQCGKIVLFNAACKRRISLYKIKTCEGGVAVTVTKSNEKALLQLCAERGFQVTFLSCGGLKGIAKTLKAHLAAICTLVPVIALTVFFSSFVYGVEISGNYYVSSAQIENVLKDCGVSGFTAKGSIDRKKIALAVSGIDGIAFASVNAKGNKLCINVKEELAESTPLTANRTPVTSTCTATVTKVVVQSGTAAVQAGSTVRAGDCLILPEYTFTEGVGDAPAVGEVYGVVVYKKEAVLRPTMVESVRTGNNFTSCDLYFGGKLIAAGGKCGYADYDKETTCVKVDAAGAFIVQKNTYYERESRVTSHDVDAEAESVCKTLQAELASELPFFAEVRASRTVQKKIDNSVYVVVYYEVEQRIDSLFAFGAK